MSDTEKFVYGLVVTQASRLQDVLNANGWGTITLPVATFRMNELTQHNIKKILIHETTNNSLLRVNINSVTICTKTARANNRQHELKQFTTG